MTNRDIINNLNNIRYLTDWQSEMLGKGTTTPLPVKITFAINKNKKLMTNEYDFYVEQLNELNAKYNITFDENRNLNTSHLSEEELAQYNTEFEQLQSINVNVELQKITQEDFGNYSPALIELDILEFMMED